MTEEELRKAILDNPDEEALRLVYADCLEEQGQTLRAEFIRGQCQLESLADDDPRWEELVQREQQLLQYRDSWERPDRTGQRPSWWRFGRWLRWMFQGSDQRWFRRGLVEEIETGAEYYVEEIETGAEYYLAKAPVLWSALPLRQLFLHDASLHVEALAADSRLDNLRTLYLCGDLERDDALEQLLDSARRSGLRAVELRLPGGTEQWCDMLLGEELPEQRPDPDTDSTDLAGWGHLSQEQWTSLRALLRTPRVRWLHGWKEFWRVGGHRPELLRLNETMYLGKPLKDFGAWAVAKPHNDNDLDLGDPRVGVVALFKRQSNSDGFDALRASPYFWADRT